MVTRFVFTFCTMGLWVVYIMTEGARTGEGDGAVSVTDARGAAVALGAVSVTVARLPPRG